MIAQGLLFGRKARPTATHRTSAPYQAGSGPSQAGAACIEPESRTLRGMLLQVLAAAGPVSSDGRTGGATIPELAAALSDRRGRLVKETTICGRLGELRRLGIICESGRIRLGNSGVQVTVWMLTPRLRYEGAPR